MKYYRIKNKDNKTFKYIDENKKVVTNQELLEYFKKLVIPPNYSDVVISPGSEPVVKARDTKNRIQAMYSKEYRNAADIRKFCSLIPFSKVINKIRKDVDTILDKKKITRETMIALILKILDKCHFRIGNEKYLKENQSYGVSTLRKEHIKFKDNKVYFEFIGKKGVLNKASSDDQQIIKLLKRIMKINDDYIFIDNGILVSSKMVNEWLSKYGKKISTKTYRTWEANILFIDRLRVLPISDKITKRKKDINRIRKEVAEELHHTATVCKKSYLCNIIYDMYIEDPEHYKMLIKNNKSSSDILITFLKTLCNK